MVCSGKRKNIFNNSISRLILILEFYFRSTKVGGEDYVKAGMVCFQQTMLLFNDVFPLILKTVILRILLISYYIQCQSAI